MDGDAEMMARHARLLARYAEQTAELTADLHAAALAAEAAAEKQSLALAFHRLGRTLRQTIALEAKLSRDHAREARLEQDRADKARQAKVAARKNRVESAIDELIWDQVEDAEQLTCQRLLAERLEAEDLADPEIPVEILIARIAAHLGLDAPRTEVNSNTPHHPGRSEAESRDPGPAHGPPGSRIGLSAVRDDAVDDDYWSSA